MKTIEQKQKSNIANVDNIKIAFCFDENIVNQACVAIANLIDVSISNNIHYDIYCLCNKEAAHIESALKKIVAARDGKTNVYVKKVNNLYEGGYEIRGITSGAYLRLQLHKELSGIDKIIYSDVDVFFHSDLQDLWNTDMRDNIIMGPKSRQNIDQEWEEHLEKHDYWKDFKKNSYINSGLLLMDLQKIREEKLEEKWLKLHTKNYFYQDQDIINITCKGKIGFIPPHYIRMESKIKDKEKYIASKIYTAKELEKMIEEPVITHYAGPKPWDNKKVFEAGLWIEYVKSQPDLKKICKNLPVFKRNILKKVKKENGKRKIYLFGVKIFSYKKKDSNIFTTIYKNNLWGNSESRSGSSSTLDRTVELRNKLPEIIKKYNVKTFIDAPCGDLNWMSKLIDNESFVEQYIGCDIVPEIIKNHKNKYKNKKNVKFYEMNIVKDKLPKADMIMTRDCLFHLPQKDIFKFLKNFANSDIKYLLTTTHINNEKFMNTDIEIGGWRYLDLHIDPYNFPEPIEKILDGGGDRYLSLFSKDQVKNLLNNK